MNMISSNPNEDFQYSYSDKEFSRIIELVNQWTGIHLSREKKPLTYSRYSKIIRRRQLHGFADYIALVEEGDDEVTREFINSITTNFTSFYREDHHFTFLQNYLLSSTNKRPVKIWSAGCSTGEEPYTIAMTIKEAQRRDRSVDACLLATDLDRDVLARAEAGVYAADRIEGLTKERKTDFFLKGCGNKLGMVRVKPEVRNLIDFAQLNLMDSWSLPHNMDIIFCRNVMIYFNKATQKMLIDKFAKVQSVGSKLVIGHSENIGIENSQYKLIGKTIYERV